MPHVEYIHVAINLGTAEGKELAEALAGVPERQRSAVVREALLAHFRSGAVQAHEIKRKPCKQLRNCVSQEVPPKPPVSFRADVAEGQSQTSQARRIGKEAETPAAESPIENGSDLDKKAKSLFDLIQ